MGEMRVLDGSGDTRHMWDPTKSDEVAAARAIYDSLMAKGYTAFRTDDQGQQAARLEKFDPEARRMVLVPPVAGG